VRKAGKIVSWSLRQIPKLEGAFMAMDVNTGRVLAMQGGFSYQTSVFNRSTQATRQPGSSFKPFVYAAALDSGYSPDTVILDAPIKVKTPQGIWEPQNAEHDYYGAAPMRIGIVHSRNLMTVRLARDVGMKTVARYAERFGVYDHLAPYLANALGSQETTQFKLVAAYAMFANGGERVQPTLVDRVQDRYGRTIYRHDQRRCLDCQTANLPPGVAPRIVSNRKRVIDAITAYQLTSMMRGVVKRGTAAGYVKLPVPVAGKTGTTDGAKDVWFTGFTSNIVASCYMGFDRPRPLGRGHYGGNTCGPVFNDFMQVAVKEYGGGPFRVPPGGVFVKTDRYSGERLPDNAVGDNVVQEYYRKGEEPGFGALSAIDGGFAMGSNLSLFGRNAGRIQGQPGGNVAVTPGATGIPGAPATPAVPATSAAPGPNGSGQPPSGNATFGTVSSGGLY